MNVTSTDADIFKAPHRTFIRASLQPDSCFSYPVGIK